MSSLSPWTTLKATLNVSFRGDAPAAFADGSEVFVFFVFHDLVLLCREFGARHITQKGASLIQV
jgi:hypothetical protein